MTDLIIKYLTWVLSILTIYVNILAGNKHKTTWIVGMLNELLWLVWIICSESFGFIPANILMWVICIRNHKKWSLT